MEFEENQERYSRRELIQDVLDGAFQKFDVHTMADYDAVFSDDEPYFINIWTHQAGKGYGYIVFHDFLRRVGVDHTFVSSDFTEPGNKLFDKAQQDGLIVKVDGPFGLQRYTRWKVVSDPTEHLKELI